jgi:hypothetical protein
MERGRAGEEGREGVARESACTNHAHASITFARTHTHKQARAHTANVVGNCPRETTQRVSARARENRCV